MKPWVCFLLVALSAWQQATAQDRFRLVAPRENIVSDARISDRELAITDARGQVTIYLRQPQFDSRDGQWLGFFDNGTRQVIRWPVSNTGNMQIGEVAGATVNYRTSRMMIEPVGRIANRPILPSPNPNIPLPGNPIPGFAVPGNALPGNPLAGLTPDPLFSAVLQNQRAQSQMIQLANIDNRGIPSYLVHDRFSSVTVNHRLNAGDSESHWWIVPAGYQTVRVQHYDNGRMFALTANRGNQVSLAPLNQDPRQLWHINTLSVAGGQFILESVGQPGMCLSHVVGQPQLQPIHFGPGQLWIPVTAPLAPNYEPFWRTVQQEIIANPPLPPAQLTLTHSHRHAVFVLLADQRQPGKVQQIRIEPNQTATVTLERDAGATLVESYEVRSASGLWDRQQITTTIPPQALYDISVYEEFLQSIAIDRTGKSPNMIEDVNYMPKSVGWFAVPAGAQLPQASTMDVLAQAKSANNPGAVRPMDKSQFEKPKADPLEKILDDVKVPTRRIPL